MSVTHRRRSTRLACAAAAVALVGGSLAGIATVGGVDLTPPGAEPTLSQAELQELGTQALSALEKEEPPVTFTVHTGVTGHPQDEQYALSHSGSSPLRWVKGADYDLVARCEGRGTVTVAWQAPGGPTGSAAVICGGDTVRVRFVPQADGPHIQIKLTPDTEATGRSGIAFGVTEYS